MWRCQEAGRVARPGRGGVVIGSLLEETQSKDDQLL